jgi:hypothetical protein
MSTVSPLGGVLSSRAPPIRASCATPASRDVGSRGTFLAAGFAEVSRPTLRRVVMRMDF